MAPERNSAPLLDEREPPFLQEPTVVVDARPLRPAFDEIVDFLYRWRLALALGLAPVVLAAIAVSYDPEAPSDPALSAESGVSSDAIVANAELADEATPRSSGVLATGDIGVSAALAPSDEPVQTSGSSRPPTTDDQAATSSAPATAATAAPPASETTTPTSEPTTTTTEAPTTTTEAPT
ncbi:MAG: hypothetical protein OEV40_27405, partial [Acidimicrobiia bacterium]|nr:hypothetical protein [Acidimicrobiia bacterium]